MYALSLGWFLLTSWNYEKSNSLSVERSRCSKYLPISHNSIKTKFNLYSISELINDLCKKVCLFISWEQYWIGFSFKSFEVMNHSLYTMSKKIFRCQAINLYLYGFARSKIMNFFLFFFFFFFFFDVEPGG